MRKRHTAVASAADAGLRVDKFLAASLPELSRARLQGLLSEGAIVRDGAVIEVASERVKPGQQFVVEVPEPRPAEPPPEARALDVLYEDAHVLVLDKPAGLVVHPAPGHRGGTLVNALLSYCGNRLSGIGGVQRPGIVHRLDKDVSGLMVVAKTDLAHLRLAAQFGVHRAERLYEAIAFGQPPRARGTIDGPIGRDPHERKRMAVVKGGKPARTHYTLLRRAPIPLSWLRVTLETGRTHQIRVHLRTLGQTIVGDSLYQARRLPRLSESGRRWLSDFDRIALHARVLAFEHPETGAALRFERPPPPEFEVLFATIGVLPG